MTRAAVFLVLISTARWVEAERRGLGPAPPADSAEARTLDDHVAATEAAVEEASRRSRPLDHGERLDPNRAPAVELDRLPGVGPATADAIVAARDGGLVFRTAGDLTAVRGIGPATVERIRPFIALPEREAGRDAPTRRARAGAAERDEPAATRAIVDLNRADAAALEGLPGIGPALARRIIEARSERPFRSLDDLERVRGIGPATVGRLRGLARAGPIR